GRRRVLADDRPQLRPVPRRSGADSRVRRQRLGIDRQTRRGHEGNGPQGGGCPHLHRSRRHDYGATRPRHARRRPLDEHDRAGWDVRLEWEKHLGEAGWIGLGWPKEYGGRGATITQQLIFNEEYAKANAPARVSFFGEGLLGPTLIAFGTEEQKQRFLPGILRATELWCQGFSEPDAGSDLANVKTRAIIDG